jgi:tRNA G18 (ribose-2'-O)-methylase SpoU
VDWEIVASESLENKIPGDYQLIALETSSDALNIFELTFPRKTAFIIGNEVNGISERLLNKADTKIFIPIPGPVTSLNVSHSLSVGLFEWLRQMSSQK